MGLHCLWGAGTTVPARACAQAYLKGDVGVLQQHCSPECVERMAGIIRAEQQQEVCLPLLLRLMHLTQFIKH